VNPRWCELRFNVEVKYASVRWEYNRFNEEIYSSMHVFVVNMCFYFMKDSLRTGHLFTYKPKN